VSIELRFHLPRSTGFVLDANLSLPGSGITALFGRSGCGKTTLLRCLAGLERVPDGLLQVNGEHWQYGNTNLPTHRRAIGFVFQEASLFPHLNVRGNLNYGYRRVPKAEWRIAFDDAVAWLGLEDLLGHYPAQLSGGQRQRVAVARALLTSPKLLLMDEPLASLDAASKSAILPYLEQLPSRLETPILYVSHAIDEVAQLADHMVLLEDGRCLADGPLQHILTRTDLPLAHADNAVAMLKARVSGYDAEFHLASLQVGSARLQVPSIVAPRQDWLRVRVAARDVMLARSRPADISALNIVEAIVVEISTEAHPAFRIVRLELDGQPLLARLTQSAVVQLGLQPGDGVYCMFKSVSLA
jgi:molybdate transport system ATP-binding protein